MTRLQVLRGASAHLRPSRVLRPELRSDLEGRRAVAFIVAATVAQVLFLAVGCDWDLCGDEAEYWAWSRRLDWSYYCRGPLTALAIRVSTFLVGDLSRALTGTRTLAVRLPAVLASGLSAWGIFRLAVLTGRGARAGLIAVLLVPCVPLFRFGSLVMTPDPLLVCCWTWAALWAYRGLTRDDLRAWTVAGLIAALGVLSKHSMLVFPTSVGLFLVLSGTQRRQLLRPGFWTMSCLCGLALVTILLWDARHGWVASAQFADRVGLTSGGSRRFGLSTLAFLGGEMVVWGLWWFVGATAIIGAFIRVLGRSVRGASVQVAGGRTFTTHLTGEDDRGLLYLLCLWLVLWSTCLAASLLGESEPNWTAPAYVSVLVLAGGWLDRVVLRRGTNGEWGRPARVIAALWVASFAGLSALQHTEWFYPRISAVVPRPTRSRPAPLRRLDPTCRMRGYRELAPQVQRVLDVMRAQGRDPFVLTPVGQLASELAFYLPGQPRVYSLAWTEKMASHAVSQHDLWRPNPRFDPSPFKGRPAVVVEPAGISMNYAHALARRGWFAHAGETARLVVHRQGLPVAAWDITVCLDYRWFAMPSAPNPAGLAASDPWLIRQAGRTEDGYAFTVQDDARRQ